MRRYLTYTFPAGNKTDVCKFQNLAAAGNLLLNGNLASQIGSEVNFLSQGYSRSISISSTDNLPTRVFTIIGKQNGQIVKEEITGINSETKFGTEIFDVITSISCSGAANDISIGTGHSGYFPIININLQRAVINYSLSLFKLTAVTIPTVIVKTLDNIAQNGLSFSNQITPDNIFSVKALNADDQYILPPNEVIPCHSFIIYIEGSDVTVENSIRMNFIQV